MTPAALLIAALPFSPNAVVGDSLAATHARLALYSEEPAAVPGDTLHLGVSFSIDPGWHLYWNGQNDTGLPIAVDLALPPGFTAGEILWPAPVRHVSPGNILDYVYFDRVTLIVPVLVPPEARSDRAITLKATANWLECKDVCLPARADTTLTLPRPAQDPQGALRFREARARLPRPLPPEAGIEIRWRGNTLRVEAPGAHGLSFFPLLESAKLSHPQEDGATAAGGLDLRVAPPDPGGPAVISGVLEVQSAEGPRYYVIREPLPQP